MLVLAGGLADDEGDVPRGHVLLELLRQQPLQRLIGAEGLAVFPDAAEPVGLGGVVGQPGVGAGEHQQAAAAKARSNVPQEAGRFPQPVDQVGGEHQVVVAVLGLEVAGIPLAEVDPLALLATKLVAGEARLAIFHQIPFHRHRIAEAVLSCQGQGHVDEAGRVVHPVHVGEAASQFEAGPAGGAADVERPLMATALLAGKTGQSLGVVGDPEVVRTVLEVEILGDQGVGFIRVHDDGLLMA